MRRNTVNLLVDILSLLVMSGMIATGLVIRFVLPPGTGGRHGGAREVLWGMGRHDWGDVHFWLAVAIVALLLAHVALHWTWVCGTVQRFVGRGGPEGAKTPARTRNMYGAGFLAVVIVVYAAFLWIARANVATFAGEAEHDDPATRRHGHDGRTGDRGEDHRPNGGRGQGKGWGSMTLAELEADTGVPVAVIREKLGLPDTVPPDERLGRLGSRYGFRMSAVRDIIETHRDEADGESAGR